MATYKVIGSITGLAIGQTVTDEQLDTEFRGLGGAQRLLDLKSIERVSDSAAPAVTATPLRPAAPHASPPTDDLDSLTVVDLKDRAKAAGIDGYSNMHKQDLIDALRKAK